MAGNIPHGLAAALLTQAGLRQRYGALATAVLFVGSELPDLDALFELRRLSPPPARHCSLPERLAAQRSAAQRAFGWCWTCGSG
jgi:hypothetical protein